MNWATIKEAIRQAVVSATGIPEQRVQWMNNPAAGVWRDSPLVDLVLRSPRALGVDETRRVYNSEDDKQDVTLEGPRQFTVSVRIEAESQLDAEESVGQLASDFRTRLRRPAILAALRAVEVALVEIAATVDADFEADGRAVSLSVTDVVFSSAEMDTDTTNPGDYIARVGLQGQAGTDLERILPFEVVAPEEAATSAPVLVTAPQLAVVGETLAGVGSVLVIIPGSYSDASLQRQQILRNGEAITELGENPGATYTVQPEDAGTDIRVREIASGPGGSLEVLSTVVAVPLSVYDPDQEPGWVLDLWGEEEILTNASGVISWQERALGLKLVPHTPPYAPSISSPWRNGYRGVRFTPSDWLVGAKADNSIIPDGGSLTIYLFGELFSLAGTATGTIVDFQQGRFQLMFNSSPAGVGWLDSAYRSIGVPASLGAHCWTFKLQHGGNGQVYQDGNLLGSAPFVGQGLGGLFKVGLDGGAAGPLDATIGRLLIYSQVHDTAIQARIEQWGREYYLLP
jgi:hypothetical protein